MEYDLAKTTVWECIEYYRFWDTSVCLCDGDKMIVEFTTEKLTMDEIAERKKWQL